MFQIFKKRIKTLIFFLVLVLIGYFIYSQRISSTQNKIRNSTKVVRGTLEEIMIISGETDAQEKVALRFQTSGKLSWVGVKEGDYVKKYHTIAALDQREVQSNLNKYLNTYLSERWDFDQVIKDDYKDKVVTDAIKRIKEKAQFDLNNSVIDVEIKNLAVELSNLVTPIEGIVTKVATPYAGTNITPAGAEFEIINPKTIFFSANADQTEVKDLKNEMIGKLVLDAYPEEEYEGKISNISFIPQEDETGTVYQIKFIFANDNSDFKIRIGMAGDLSFVTQKIEDVLYIPLKFVKEERINNQLKKYVFVKINDKYEKRYITTGLETEDEVEITSGLSDNELIYDANL